MLDYGEYITSDYYGQDDGNGYHNNGYDQLQGKWATYYKVAKWFANKVKRQDKYDFLHDTMLEMAKVEARYEAKGKPLTEAGLMRVASYELKGYYQRNLMLTTMINCTHCSKEQRRKCREQGLYSQCPKYHNVISLDMDIDDGDGNKARLVDFIADDKAIDIVARLDARRFLQSFPTRLVKIAYKKYAGYPLNHADTLYWIKWQKENNQKSLIR
jgi:hypothetical protein